MKQKFKGSKTEQNLINAFAGESQARNRYTFFANKAKKEGYEQISAIFLETAENEKEHAKLFYNHIKNSSGKVDGIYPFENGTTEENLISAINGEHEEWSVLYPQSEQIAREEGFYEIADTFHNIINSEQHHEQRYQKLLKIIQEQSVFKKTSKVEWICRKCGYVHIGNSAPETCPNCKHPQGYFEILCEKY